MSRGRNTYLQAGAFRVSMPGVPGPSRYVYIDTGFPNLNELLSRRDWRGFVVPTGEGCSTIVTVKGAAGTGKSVLAVLLARNFLRGPLKLKTKQKKIDLEDDARRTSAFPIYFSFGQHPTILKNYLQRILAEGQPAPLILAPSDPRALGDTRAVPALRRILVAALASLRDPLARTSIPRRGMVTADTLRDWVEGMRKDKKWTFDPEGVNHSEQSALPVVFVDPINIFFHTQESRQALVELFSTFRRMGWPLFALLEDGGSSSSPAHQQLGKLVEFESDTVIELKQQRGAYFRRVVSIEKNRHSHQRYGEHFYRIEDPKHALSSMMLLAGREHRGFFIFPSIHLYLSKTRDVGGLFRWVTAGITPLDDDSPEPKAKGRRARIPSDSSVVIRGSQNGHKFALAFNVLIQGLLSPDKTNRTANTVLLLFMGEEANLEVDRIARTEANADLTIGSGRRAGAKDPQKVKVETLDVSKGRPAVSVGHVVVAYFRPGFLPPEEFLWIVEALLEHYEPSRILFHNTAHLRMRFPELERELMLLPALTALAHSRRKMFIVVDVEGPGSSKQLSIGLSAAADYVIWVDPKGNHTASKGSTKPLSSRTNDGPRTRDLSEAGGGGEETARSPSVSRGGPVATISNVRGKRYEQKAWHIVVDAKTDPNQLRFVPVTRGGARP